MAKRTPQKKHTPQKKYLSPVEEWRSIGYAFEPISWDMETQVTFPKGGVKLDDLIEALRHIRKAHPGIEWVEELGWDNSETAQGRNILAFRFSGTDREYRETERVPHEYRGLMKHAKVPPPTAESA